MPERETIARARKNAREGKSPSTQAGEFVREEIRHVRKGKHGARSPEQAVAIGLSKARRGGIKLVPPKGPDALRKKAERDTQAGENRRRKISGRRSRAVSEALKREPKSTASRKAMSERAKTSAARRSRRSRSQAARKAGRTRRAA